MKDELLVANQEFLSRYFPALASGIQQDPPQSAAFPIEWVSGKRGSITVRARIDGNWKYLHSQYDPQNEASRWAAAHPPPPGAVVLFYGWGMGLHIFEWIKQHGSSVGAIIILEPEPELFLQSLRYIDLRGLVHTPRMEILLGVRSEILYPTLLKYVHLVLCGEIMVTPLPFASIYPGDGFELLQKEIRRFAATQQGMLRHMADFGYPCQTHLIRNLAATARGFFPREIKNVARKQPAIIVAAGPSLDRNIQELPQVQGRAWILAVDTALRILNHHGVHAHIVVSKDPTEKNEAHFEGLENISRPMLAFDPQVSPSIPARFVGPGIVLPNRNHRLHQFIPELELKPEDELPFSTNVALAAFNLAVVMGCEPIIFVGLDLCFPQGRGQSHATHSALTAHTDYSEENKILTYQRGPASDTTEAVLVEGIDGQYYPTTSSFYESLRLLETLIRESGAVCIDATEGGAKIGGTTIMTLSEAIQTYCREVIDPSVITDRPHPNRSREKIRKSLLDIAHHIDFCRQIAENALQQMSHTPAPPLSELETARNRIEEGHRIYGELESALERLMVEIYRPRFWDSAANPPETLVKHYEGYFQEIVKAAQTFVPLYEQAAAQQGVN